MRRAKASSLVRGISLRLAVSKWLGEAAAADVTTAADEDGESIVVGGIGADGGGGGVYCSTRMSRCRVCGGWEEGGRCDGNGQRDGGGEASI